MKKAYSSLLVGALFFGVQCISHAGTVSWTDWTSEAPGQVNGNLTFGATSIDVTFSGDYHFTKTNGGKNFWLPNAPYISTEVSNPPPDSDIIALNIGGAKTITFSQAVQDPVIGLVSWNSNTVDFGEPIEILSYGQGYWGNGTPVLNATGTGFYGSGEVHGVIRLPGVHTSITFTDTSENWHGITVGAASLAAVPLPASVWLLSSGLVGLVGFIRRAAMNN